MTTSIATVVAVAVVGFILHGSSSIARDLNSGDYPRIASFYHVRDPHARNPWLSTTSLLPKPTLSPVPPVYQVHIRLGSPDSSAIAPARPIARRSPSAPSRNSMRRENCGNFSVANIVMNAEALQEAGVTPAPPQRAARCSVLSCSRGTRSPNHAVVLHARAAKFQRKALKVRGSVSSHIPQISK
jgi:hypothetical protein